MLIFYTDDVLGAWSCPQIGKEQSFAADAKVQTIVNSLYKAGLQYTNNLNDSSYIDIGFNNKIAHFVVWSSSAPSDDANVPFNILVSADTNPDIGNAVVMRTYNCSVAGSQSLTEVNKILAQMESYTTLRGWQTGLEAVLYSGAGTGIDYNGASSQQGLEIYLNGLTMVQGGNDSIISEMLSTDNNPYYGCMTSQTSINQAVILMVVLTAVLFLIITAYYLVLLLILKFGSSNAGSKHIKPIPDSTLSWMLQAARENAISTGVSTGEDGRLVDVPRKVTELRSWRFQITDSVVGVARIMRERRGLSSPAMSQGELVYQDNFQLVGK
jgi:hypothetical protein